LKLSSLSNNQNYEGDFTMRNKWSGVVRLFSCCEEMLRVWDDEHYLLNTPPVLALGEKYRQLLGLPTLFTTRGMTAIQALVMNYTSASSIIACSEDVYPGTRRFLTNLLYSERVANLYWFDPANYAQIRDLVVNNGVGLVFSETCGNAMQMRVCNPKILASLCYAQNCTFILDTTFTPLFTLPLRPEFSRTFIVASMTKYDQQSDDQMGGRISASDDLIYEIQFAESYQTVAMLPSTAVYYLNECDGNVIQMRHEEISKNTLTLAIACNGLIQEVYYPGLPTHPQNNIVQQDFHGFAGGVFYMRLPGGAAMVKDFCDRLVTTQSDWQLAVSFGAPEWRVLPFIGPIEKKGQEGLIRVSPGTLNPSHNISKFLQVLRSIH